MLISIRNLRKIYRMGEVEVRALDGLDLEVEKPVIISPSWVRRAPASRP